MDPTTIGRYQVIEEVGAGGFATVYRARDPVLDREVAVKLLHPHLARDPQLRERFVREGRALARVRHPNVVQVYDAGEAEAGAYLAMEFVPGRSLADIAQDRPLTLDDLLPILRQIAPAIDAVHAAGLLHRDIKPANILVADDGRAVLLDLGIARTMERTALTTSSLLVGTPGYLAPEQVEMGETGPRTDVYQLGATTYALLSGRPPFSGETAQVLYAIVHRAPPDLAAFCPDLPPTVVAEIDLALSKDPSHRPPSAIAFVAGLEGRSQPTIPLPGAHPPRPTGEPHGRASDTGRVTPMAVGPAVVRGVAGSGPPAPSPTSAGTHPVAAGGARGSSGVSEHAALVGGSGPGGVEGDRSGATRAGGRRGLLLFAAGAAAALVLVGGALAVRARRGDSGREARRRAAVEVSATIAPETPSPAPTLTPSATPPAGSATAGASVTQSSPTPATTAPTPTPRPSPTPALPTPTPRGGLVLPTPPERRIAIPEGASPTERAILDLLNRNGPAVIAALRQVDEQPLRGVFSGPAYDQYAREVQRLRSAGHYAVADLRTVSLTEFHIDSQDAAFARTTERWMQTVYESDGNRRVSCTQAEFNEEYRFVYTNGAWLIQNNPFSTVDDKRC